MRNMKRISAWILTLALLFTLAVPAFAASSVQSEMNKSAAYMLSSVKAPEVGSIGGEWAVLGLARSGYSVPANYFEDYYVRVEKYVKDCSGVLHERKYTEYSRVILALTSIGRDPSNVAGYNLLTPLGDFEKTIWQGLNGPIWALIALDSGNYNIPKNTAAKTQATRQLYIYEILSRQQKDGGWNLTGTGDSDPDMRRFRHWRSTKTRKPSRPRRTAPSPGFPKIRTARAAMLRGAQPMSNPLRRSSLPCASWEWISMTAAL